MFISNRPLSAVLAALAAAAALVVTDELYQPSECLTETAETSAAHYWWLCRTTDDGCDASPSFTLSRPMQATASERRIVE